MGIGKALCSIGGAYIYMYVEIDISDSCNPRSVDFIRSNENVHKC